MICGVCSTVVSSPVTCYISRHTAGASSAMTIYDCYISVQRIPMCLSVTIRLDLRTVIVFIAMFIARFPLKLIVSMQGCKRDVSVRD